MEARSTRPGPKGIHTAGLAVLFEAPPTLDALSEALADYPELNKLPEPDEVDWMWMTPGVVVPLSDRGRAIVQIFHEAWPDGMGDPKQDPSLFAAWSMGFFGPGTYPGGLARAVAQSWAWSGAKAAVEAHRCFVRIRVTYPGEPNDPVVPPDYDPLDELQRVSRLALAVAGMPGAVAWFAPIGEVLMPPGEVAACLDRGEPPPIEAWTNARLHRIENSRGWTLADTVGMTQFDLPDIEACATTRFEADDVLNFLRNVSLYLFDRAAVVKDGDTLDGPGGTWVFWSGEALLDPPRSTWRLFPADVEPPQILTKGTQRPPGKKPGLWKRLFS